MKLQIGGTTSIVQWCLNVYHKAPPFIDKIDLDFPVHVLLLSLIDKFLISIILEYHFFGALGKHDFVKIH